MKKLSRPSIWQRFPRKWWLIGAAVSLIVLLAGFVGWSMYAWSDYKQQYESWYGELRSEARATLEMKAGSSGEKAKKLTALIRVGETVKRGSLHCNAHAWIHWQQFIGEVKGRIDGCRSKQRVSEVFAGDLKAVTSHLQSEAAVGAVLAAATVGKEVEESSWEQIAGKWANARADVRKLQLAPTMKGTQKIAEEKAAALEAAWRGLIAANAAKDRQKYEAALDQIATAYGSLSGISEAAQSALRPLASKLEVSYRRVFS